MWHARLAIVCPRAASETRPPGSIGDAWGDGHADGGKHSDYSFWEEAGTAVTHALGHGGQDQPPSDPRSNLP